MSLASKMDRLKDEHADEEFNKLQNFHEQQSMEDALFVLGRIKQNDHIGEAISNNLSTQTILALQRFQQEKKFEALGFDTFDQFLNQSPYSPMTKAQYYERLAIVNKHGLDVADLLTSIGISMRSQKLLESGDVSIKNDKLYIGEKELEVADTGIIKEVLGELFDERRELKSKLAAAEAKLDKKEEQIKKGTEEIQEQQRYIDSINEDGPFKTAFGKAISALQSLALEATALPDDEKKTRAEEDLRLLTTQWYSVRDAYGSKIALSDNTLDLMGIRKGMKSVEEMTDEEKKATFLERAAATIDAEEGMDDLD